jgi:ribonucleoside-triphosphate reductase
MRTVAEIDGDLAARRAELASVKGTETEVYSRIVGYYRSLRNWNHGKKAEFQERKTYSAELSLTNREPGDEAMQLQLFTRANCPGCRVAKQMLNTMPELGSRLAEVDIDTPVGLDMAEQEMILVTPTLIARDPQGRELWRSSDPRQMQQRLTVAEGVSA